MFFQMSSIQVLKSNLPFLYKDIQNAWKSQNPKVLQTFSQKSFWLHFFLVVTVIVIPFAFSHWSGQLNFLYVYLEAVSLHVFFN